MLGQVGLLDNDQNYYIIILKKGKVPTVGYMFFRFCKVKQIVGFCQII